jgi:hypothetical protein
MYVVNVDYLIYNSKRIDVLMYLMIMIKATLELYFSGLIGS